MIMATQRIIVDRNHGIMLLGSRSCVMLNIWMMLPSVPVTTRSSDKVNPNLRMPFRLLEG